ncbi:hypothetical protein [Sporisorium scitamineum]|uniref:Uncharacterized protein n=1 Tax=Sporisorium scitamineum TaxID=49012 RepID=A0A0F7S0N4_9BASI|nr:hypothetical protein [Sporisorium scitamineum]
MSNLNNTSDTVSQSSAPLGLPAPSDVPTSTEPNNVIKLDHLGPMVVNSDGTISRIANWQNLSDIEKERSLKLLAKRNNTRMDSLKFKQAHVLPCNDDKHTHQATLLAPTLDHITKRSQTFPHRPSATPPSRAFGRKRLQKSSKSRKHVSCDVAHLDAFSIKPAFGTENVMVALD